MEPPPKSWGVSKSQSEIAAKVEVGDFLLHFIDGAQVWAGYSKVIGEIKQNDRDKDADWREALPEVIPIERITWLNKQEAYLTLRVPSLVGENYHRVGSFKAINSEEAERIIAAINNAKGKSSTPTEEFEKLWNRDAERFYWEIARRISGGKCWLCSESAESWVKSHSWAIPDTELEKIRERFIDIAHIEDRADDGKLSPNNVRGLCPSCHRVMDRIPKQRKKDILLGKKPGF